MLEINYSYLKLIKHAPKGGPRKGNTSLDMDK